MRDNAKLAIPTESSHAMCDEAIRNINPLLNNILLNTIITRSMLLSIIKIKLMYVFILFNLCNAKIKRHMHALFK